MTTNFYKWVCLRIENKKPKRHQLAGMSPSEFRTKMKRAGFHFDRGFPNWSNCVAMSPNKDRYYRVRPDSGEVDMSCPVEDFDRWANSTDETWSMEHFVNYLKSVK